jgi:urease accessory protein
MGVGFAVGASGVVLPAVELGVVASVFVLGLLALGAVRMPAVGAGLVVSAFAVFHGHAHAADMPAGALLAGYGAGLAASSAVLLATAGGLALFARHVGAMQRFAAERVAGGVYVNIFRLPISGR